MSIHIGTQGWNYDAWVGGFYPPGTRAQDYLDLYVKVFETVEVDSTFYAAPAESTIQSWTARAPAGFTWSLKLPREMSHENRLVDCGAALLRFCERARCFGAQLGLILIQLPPDMSPRAFASLARFLDLLPLDIDFAVEFRDRAWLAPENAETLLDVLREHKTALALTDSKWIPRELIFELLPQLIAAPTADFAYVRWMGPRELTDFSRVQINRDTELAEWTTAIAQLRTSVRRIHGYFNNHYMGHSPASANQFRALLGQTPVSPETLITQPSLF
ncbi:MAG: DUF72 domain-containing protein [Blastocatellia bacterium]